MFHDLKTIVWKECRELFRGKTNQRQLLGKLFAPAVLAAVFPVTWGSEWVNEFPALIIAVIIPAVLVGVMIPDSFAGERERHTLDTLLASRLSDTALLLGKMIIPVVVSWVAALLFTFISLIVVNLAHYEGELLMYSTSNLLGIFSLSFISSTLMTNSGVLISLKSSGTQEATQKLMTFVLLPVMLVQIVPMLFRDQVLSLIQGINGQQLLGFCAGILFLVDLIIFLLVFRKFQRSKLYLD